MLTERDLLETIEECRVVRNPTAATCQLMAACYTIYDHMFPANSRPVDVAPVNLYSATPAPKKAEIPSSDFAIAANSAGMPRLLEVLDEHMQCVQALYPKAYAAIMRKLKNPEN